MKQLLAISTSTSSKSINKQLLEYFVEHLDDYQIEIIDLISDVPIYNQDLEDQIGFSQSIVTLSHKLKQYDGFILALPEHNGSMTAILKNNIDWLSRVDRNIFNDKAVLLISTTPGPTGGKYVTSHVQNVIPFLGAKSTMSYNLNHFYEKFNENGLILDEQKLMKKSLENFKGNI